jgi:hypothetical protein
MPVRSVVRALASLVIAKSSFTLLGSNIREEFMLLRVPARCALLLLRVAVEGPSKIGKWLQSS